MTCAGFGSPMNEAAPATTSASSRVSMRLRKRSSSSRSRRSGVCRWRRRRCLPGATPPLPPSAAASSGDACDGAVPFGGGAGRGDGDASLPTETTAPVDTTFKTSLVPSACTAALAGVVTAPGTASGVACLACLAAPGTASGAACLACLAAAMLLAILL